MFSAAGRTENPGSASQTCEALDLSTKPEQRTTGGRHRRPSPCCLGVEERVSSSLHLGLSTMTPPGCASTCNNTVFIVTCKTHNKTHNRHIVAGNTELSAVPSFPQLISVDGPRTVHQEKCAQSLYLGSGSDQVRPPSAVVPFSKGTKYFKLLQNATKRARCSVCTRTRTYTNES